jgi:TetR/AcrR family transcriptional regulator
VIPRGINNPGHFALAFSTYVKVETVMASPIGTGLVDRVSKAERTRARLLCAGERLFAERGFDGTRLEDVAAAVGIRRPSILYHFRDKQALYDAVLADVFSALYTRLAAALLGAGPFATRIEHGVSAWIDVVAERPALARLLLREVADGTPAQSSRLAPHLAPFFALVERVLAAPDAVTPPSGADPIAVTSQIAGATVFFVAAMPTLLPGMAFDPLAPEQLEGLRRELRRAVRRLLALP